jgi:(p)ppGpp synthase/HD superfamily hydrolase
MDIVEKAKIFAIAAHSAVGQLRKYTHEPYWVHPFEVMETVKTVPHTPEMLAAALLHDVVEDTQVTLAVIDQEFGKAVMYLVNSLTNISKPEYGNRAFRSAMDISWIASATPAAKTVKCADIISNCASIKRYDPEFAKVYLAEKRDMLVVLTEADPVLYARAMEITKE